MRPILLIIRSFRGGVPFLVLTWLADARLYDVLADIDADLAETARKAGCRICGGMLHSACFPRKPRGGPAELPADYDRRHSFCCAAGGRRKRRTPASVRFLGRKVYLGAVVVLAPAPRHGLTRPRAAPAPTTPWRERPSASGVKLDVVHAWIKRGLAKGERNDFQAHRRVWWLEIAEDTAARLERLAAPLRRA